jgi:hypothetical protein
MPALDRDSEVEVTNSKFEQTVRYHVEKLTQVPELHWVSCQIAKQGRWTDHKCCLSIAVTQVPPMPSGSMYRSNDLTWQVQGEDRLQSLISTANYMCSRGDNLLVMQP